MVVKSRHLLILAIGIVFGILYGFMIPEQFRNNDEEIGAETLLVNYPSRPLKDTDIQDVLGIKKEDIE